MFQDYTAMELTSAITPVMYCWFVILNTILAKKAKSNSLYKSYVNIDFNKGGTECAKLRMKWT